MAILKVSPKVFSRSLLTLSITTALIASGSAFADDITIKRDGYGTPHVYANNTYDLFYGYGYSIAQDRLFSLDMARRTGTGEVSEILGAEFVDFDKQIRGNYWPWRVQEQLNNASKDQRDVLNGYAAGINAWIGHVNAQPETLMPKEYLTHGVKPKAWTGYDVAMVFIGSMIYRFGDYNTELDNAALLEALIEKHGETTGREIFNTLLALDVPDAPTTIPPGDWDPAKRESANLNLRPVVKGAVTPEILRQAATAPTDFIGADGTALPREKWRDANIEALSTHGPAALRYEGASNMAILGPQKLEGAKSVLLNGPQFGWYQPAYTYSIGLHGAGFDVAGNTVYGYPSIMFAHNGQTAWGSTWAAGDLVDLFRETLNPDNPDQYKYKGAWRDMESSEQTINVNGGDPVPFIAYRTVHGPVVARDEDTNIAYAQKRAWSGKELSTLESWVDIMKAQNFDEFKTAAAKSAVNVNLYYADAKGDIGYIFGGHYPKRAAGHDGRTPASGEGDMDWQGIMPFDTNPQVLNPSNHMLLNWNNRPAEGFPNPDQYWYSWMLADRVKVLFNEFEDKDDFTPDEVWNTVVDHASFEDVNAGEMVPFVLETVEGLPANDPRHQLAMQLQDWNYMLEDKDGDGKYDHPGVAIMQTWLTTLLTQTFASLPEPYDGIFANAGYPGPEVTTASGQNIQVGTKVLHYNLSGQGYDFFEGQPKAAILSALDATDKKLSEEYGDNMVNWLAPVGIIRYNHKNFREIPQTLPAQEQDTAIAMNRGTENNMTVFTKDGVKAWETVPPGQSGFIAPDGTTTSHYNDQTAEYAELGRKRVWFTDAEVDANTSYTQTISINRSE
ncbi:penicillin acylase family protein [uncultured Psychrobacter sp.]|uniref:penicillin acylase family protein n=1 Tax=uncultured Psychrobacter sp. TaxID=259303 RepID=UPI00345B2909